MFKNQEIVFKIFFVSFLLFFERILYIPLRLFTIQPFNHSTIKPNYLSIYLSIFLSFVRFLLTEINLEFLQYTVKNFQVIKNSEKCWDDWFG